MTGFKEKITKFLVRFFIKLGNFSYEKISKYAVILEGGLHPKHRLMKYYDFFLRNIGENDNVLDIGCGNGFVSNKISEKAGTVTGIDINVKNIEIANRLYKRENINFIAGDVTEYEFSQNFQVAVLSNVLEHIEDRVHFLKKISKKVDKILIRIPTIERSWLDLYKKELGVEYRLDKTHYIEHTKEEFLSEVKNADLNVESLEVNFGEIWAVVSS
jgi:2-polyprenyl-3-methyl-5-hydroxy-6-metoxy-1,4-benzoquinol methylase